MPRVADDRAGENAAAERLERIIIRVVTAARAMAGAQLLVGTGAVRRGVKNPVPLYAAVTVMAAESAWAAARTWRRGSAQDRAVHWADVLVADLALLGEAASWGTRRLPPDPRWSQVYGLLTGAWTSFGNGDARQSKSAMASWVATYVATTSNHALDRGGVVVRGQRYSEMAAGAVFYGVGGDLGRGLRAQAKELDAAKAEAVEGAERNAAEVEKVNQFRLLHDSALQVLETVAGSWEVDADLLLRRIQFEIDRLTRVLAGGGLAGEGGLADALDALRIEFALIGLDVRLECDNRGVPCRRSSVEVLNDATHEALINAHKHAGVATADVRMLTDATFVVVEVRDHGRGFDIAQPRSGFGVTESIYRRLDDAGGSAEVTSTPGVGTTVTLRMPQ